MSKTKTMHTSMNRTGMIKAIEASAPSIKSADILAVLVALGLPTTLITVQSTRSKIRAKNRTITFPDVNGLPVTVPESTIIRNGFRKIA